MFSQKRFRQAALPVAALALLTIGSEHGRPQGPPPGIDDIRIGTPRIPVNQVPSSPPSVDALIDQLEMLRKQKAELEAREKALVEQLQGRLKNQSDRLQKLGVVAPAAAPPVAKEDVKFLDAVVPPMPPRDDPKAFDPPFPPSKK
jgi:hypothetical protein